MASLYFQHQAGAIFYAVLERTADSEAYEYFGNKLENNSLTPASFVKSLLSGTNKYTGKTDSQILTQVYTNINKTAAADESYIQSLPNSGNDISTLVAKLITDVLYYDGFDSATLATQQTFNTQIDTALYTAASPEAQDRAADVQAFLYALGGTQGASAINYWGTQLANGSKTSAQVAQAFVNSKAPVSLYNDSQFVSLLYHNAYLRDPSAAETSYFVDKLATGTTTRTDVLLDIINTLRSTVSAIDTAAQAQFIKATHVYKTGVISSL